MVLALGGVPSNLTAPVTEPATLSSTGLPPELESGTSSELLLLPPQPDIETARAVTIALSKSDRNPAL